MKLPLITLFLVATTSWSFAAPPDELTATPSNPTTVELTWKDNSSDELLFKITRRQSGTPKFTDLASVPANTTKFQDKNLTPGLRYYYHVCAVTPSGDSALSNKADVTLPQVLPLPPAKLTATVMSNSHIALSWADASNNESGFKLERKRTTGGSFEVVINTPADRTAHSDHYLPEAQQFTYRICALNAAGASTWSNEVTAATLNTAAYLKNPGDLWVGTYQQRVGAKLYTWIPTRDATIEVQKDGKVKLVCPETKRALEGNNICQRFVYDESYRELEPDYLKALFSTGVDLPDGQYAFYVRYLNAPAGDYAHIDANIWDLMHAPGKYTLNANAAEMVSFSIEGGKPTPGEITPPANQRRVSFLASYMYLNDRLALPPNKAFGVGRYANDVVGRIDDHASLEDLFARKITHINDIPYNAVKKFPEANRWRAARCEMENRTEPLEPTIQPGETWETTFTTQATNPDYMIGDWHHHDFYGDLKGCQYKSQDIGGGKLKITIKNPTSSAQTLKGSVLIRVVWTPKTAAEQIPLDPKFIFLAEFAENGMLSKSGNAFAPIEESFKKYYERMQKQFGVTSPGQTNIYYDYFQGLYGYSTTGPNLMWSKPDEQRTAMSSPEKAMGNSKYYSEKAYLYRNRPGGAGYMDNALNSGEQVYGVIAGLEINFIANPDIKVAGMAWQATDGTPGGVTSQGLHYRRRYPGGDMIQHQDTGHPHEIMKTRCFFSMLLGNTHLLWEGGAVFSKNLDRFSTWKHNGGPPQWQPVGGKMVTWEKDNPKFPQILEHPEFKNEGSFPSQPQVGEQGAWNGAYLYSLISTVSDRVSKSVRYPKFSYSINGGPAQTGYVKSNEPVAGKSNGEVSRFGISNPGQHNIVDSFHGKKPIVMLTEGGKGAAVIIKNIWVRPTDVVTYKIQVGTSEKTITHTGRLLGVYAIR